MPSPKTGPQNGRSSEFGYLLAVTLPPLTLLLLFTLGAVRENSALQLVESQLTRLAAAGQPIDNHSMTMDFDRRLSTENSIAWRDVMSAMTELNGQFSPVSSQLADVADLSETIAPGVTWEFEPVVRRYTEQAAPILASLDQLAEDDRPVWEPLILEGFETLLPDLQESRDVSRMLEIEFRHAVHQGQPDRALRALRLIGSVGHAFDWQNCAISDLIFFAHQSTQRELIRQSLEVGFWQDDQSLERLRQQLADVDDLDARWRQMIAAEQAMLLSEVRVGEDPDFTSPPLNLHPFGISPTIAASLVESMTKASEIGGAGTLAHVRRIANEIDVVKRESSGTYTINGIPFAYSDAPLGFLVQNYSSLSAAFAGQAMDRRWTIIAVAIQQYRLAEGHLPKELGELKRVGLAPADWIAIENQPFGYRVEEDSQVAVLWTVDPVELTNPYIQVPAEPPSETSDDPDRIRRMEVRIR